MLSALNKAIEARNLELAWRAWHVSQHPMNRYPEDHMLYKPDPPKPTGDIGVLRLEASELFRDAWNKGTKLLRSTPPGTMALWKFHNSIIIPVVLMKDRYPSAWFVERMDDPDPGPRYSGKALHRVHWEYLRILTSADCKELEGNI